ncbi:hypothetical protein [Legionella fairfieldensis]|uniref:hypothetical protein n=1 Tax=Legionella fairfieldensis TaxID=45064 RepID=UPI001F5EB1DE|nr:hypothetical protein [Legionella fairfieldensis]
MSFEAAEKLQNIINEKNEEIKQLTARLEHEQLQSESKLHALQAYYENVLAVMPGYVYWLDKNNVFLGCNDLQAKSAQLKSRQDIIGKTNNDMLWKDKAEELNQLNNQVMETGVSHVEEEYVVMPNGLTIYHSEKNPYVIKITKL